MGTLFDSDETDDEVDEKMAVDKPVARRAMGQVSRVIGPYPQQKGPSASPVQSSFRR